MAKPHSGQRHDCCDILKCTAAQTYARPDLIFILCDDQGYLDIGVQGYKRVAPGIVVFCHFMRLFHGDADIAGG